MDYTKTTTNNKTATSFSSADALAALGVFAKKVRGISSKYELIDLLKDDIVESLGFSTASIFQLIEAQDKPRQLVYKGHSSKNMLIDTDANLESYQYFDVDSDPWLKHILASGESVYAHDMMTHPLPNKDIVKAMRVASTLNKRIYVANHTLIICISSYDYDPPVTKMTDIQLMYFDLMCSLIEDVFNIKALENVRLFDENTMLTPLGMRWHVSRLVSSYERDFTPFGLINITLANIHDATYSALLRALAIEINKTLRGHELLCLHGDTIVICIEATDQWPLPALVKRLSNDFASITYSGALVELLLDITSAQCPDDGFSFEDLISTATNRKVKPQASMVIPETVLFD